MKREIEVKARIEEDLSNKILEMGGKFLSEKHQEDVYFEHPCKSFLESDEALRLRVENNRSVLTFKGKREGEELKIREELEIEINDFKTLIDILEKLGFKRAYVIRKKRKEFLLNKSIICLDDVEGLGSFVELEGGPEIMEIAKKLGLKDLTTDSYLEMIIKK